MSSHQHDIERRPTQKEPAALLWIIIGLLAAVAVMIGIEHMVPRY